MTAVESSVAEARRIVANFPNRGSVPLLMEAVNEIIGSGTGMDLYIQQPRTQEVKVFETIARKNIAGLTLAYLPEHNWASEYPQAFRDRLSSTAHRDLSESSLGVSGGWRIVDIRSGNPIYEDDENFLGSVIQEARTRGDIADPSIDLDMPFYIPTNSRLALTPREIDEVINTQVDDLLELHRGTMRLPTLREAMMTSSLYNFVPIEATEWQTARFSTPGANQSFPAGIAHTHNYDGNRYFRPREGFKHKHHQDIGFRLTGKLK